MKSLPSSFSADTKRRCGTGSSLKRSFTSCSEAQFKSTGRPSLLFSALVLVQNGPSQPPPFSMTSKLLI